MRVLNLLNSTHRRGAEAFGIDLGVALSARGLDVRTVALTGAGTGAAFPVEALDPVGRGLRAAASAAAALAADADVIIGHGGRTLFAGAWAGRRRRVPFVYRVIGEPDVWAATPAQRLRVTLALRSAARVAVYHHGVPDALHRSFRVPTERIVVIPKGIALDQFAPPSAAERAEARRSFGVDTARSVVVVLGALSPAKNVEQVVEAAARVEGMTALLVGTGPDLDRWRHIAEGTTRLVVNGPTDSPARALHAADVLGITSRTEGMPTVVLEAALCGLPSVATPVGGVPDLVHDDETGFLVPLDDIEATGVALARAAEDRDRLGGAARAACIERFDIDVVAGRWADLLLEVTSARR